MMNSNKLVSKRIASYVITFAAFCLLFFMTRGLTWEGNGELHTIMEVIATLLAFLVGVMALVRYYSKKDSTLLLIGVGFFGTAMLDGYHAVVTSAAFAQFLPSDLPALIPWSWVASRFFLALLLLMSWAVWKFDIDKTKPQWVQEKSIYILVAILTVTSFAFFAFYPLPRAYYPEYVVGRPEELLPALLFIAALVGYIKKGKWKYDVLEHWLVLALIVSVVSQLFFMSFSFKLFDFNFDMAHSLKKVTYILVMVGLLYSMYETFKQSESSSKELALLNERLTRSNEELEQFAAIAAHDLKAPLRGIGYLASFIKEDVGENIDEGTQENFDLMQSRITRMKNLLDDLLSYSKAGHTDDLLEEVGLRELLDNIKVLLSPPVGFNIHINGDMATIETLRAPLQQVLTNVMSNAIKHHDQKNGNVSVKVTEEQQFIKFSIIDDGPGIPMESHERVFKMFQTLKSKDEVEGSGIGLAVVKKSVEAMGGVIEINSTEGARGTEFIILWPKNIERSEQNE